MPILFAVLQQMGKIILQPLLLGFPLILYRFAGYLFLVILLGFERIGLRLQLVEHITAEEIPECCRSIRCSGTWSRGYFLFLAM